MNVPAPIQPALPRLAASQSPGGELRHQAEVWVAQTFFGQMLKQMRDSPFRSDLFDGGRGGQAFNQMFDGVIAQRLTRGTGSRLVDPIVRKLEAGRAYRRTEPTPPSRGDARAEARADARHAPTDPRRDRYEPSGDVEQRALADAA